ncbi:MAG TPA: hypothetical protein VG012_00355 [Acidimicrobiia bacterium]|nr:hypothetical protein [Acidimicrobiia bacterium]
MANFCANCGAGLGASTSSCPQCGAPASDGAAVLDARELADATSEHPLDPGPAAGPPTEDPTPPGGVVADGGPRPPLRPDPAASAPSADDPDRTLPGRSRRVDLEAWWSAPRHRTFVAVAACGLLLGVAVGLAFAAGGRPSETTGPKAAAPPRSRPRPARAAPPAGVQQRERTYVARLEAVLQESAAGRNQLVAALRSAQGACAITPLAASQQIHAVVGNRVAILNELAALPPAPNTEAQQLEQQLQAAVRASAQADAEYEAWMRDLGQSGVDPCADAGVSTSQSFRDAARAADANATALKTQFVTSFDAVAARYGLPTWTEAGF